jgi:replication fork protection complex subunit Tof1/Swi1
MNVSAFRYFFLGWNLRSITPPRKPRCRLTIDRGCLLRTCLDADELEWYIPAGIDPPDLQRSLTIIEQFEETPFDLQGKHASQLLHKKRRRRRRRVASSSSDSENDDEAAPRKARKARERQTYKSAQFIEDSDEEYGQDIDEFFVREAALRQRIALAAADSALNIGTMRPNGTKKRRRAQPSPGTARGRGAKRRAVQSSPGTPDGDGDGGCGGNNAAVPTRRSSSSPSPSHSSDQGGDDDGTDDSDGLPSLADCDAASRRRLAANSTSNIRRPKARPLYRSVPSGEEHAATEATLPNPGRDEEDGSPTRHDGGDDGRSRRVSNNTGLPKGRLIISDEE